MGNEWSYHVAQEVRAAPEVHADRTSGKTLGMVIVWPMCAFGKYCTRRSDAHSHFSEMVRKQTHLRAELLRCVAVRRYGQVVGITRQCEILERHLPPDGPVGRVLIQPSVDKRRDASFHSDLDSGSDQPPSGSQLSSSTA
jgi:hypothetical protein